MLGHTIIGAAFQQQSAFFQVSEFPHADEIVVHSRNFPLSGLPGGACQITTTTTTMTTQFKTEGTYKLAGHAILAATWGVAEVVRGELRVTLWLTSPRGK